MDPLLERVQLERFRNFRQACYAFGTPWTGIVGPNGSGKTNLLEAVHFLFRLRGFRNEAWTRLKMWNEVDGGVSGFFGGDPFRERSLRWSGDTLQRYEDGDAVGSKRRWVCAVPIFGYRPDDDLFFHDEPRLRRKYLDWFCAYRDLRYMELVSAYDRALKQRNASLRNPGVGASEFAAWEQVLAETGVQLHTARGEATQGLRSEFLNLWAPFGVGGVDLVYKPGGTGELEHFRQCLERDRPGDADVGWTRFGPHRDDLVVEFQARPIRDSGSQGYRKLAVILLSAACAVAAPRPDPEVRQPFYLDDIEGELDATNETRLFDVLSDLPLQVLLTAVRRPPILADTADADTLAWIEL